MLWKLSLTVYIIILVIQLATLLRVILPHSGGRLQPISNLTDLGAGGLISLVEVMMCLMKNRSRDPMNICYIFSPMPGY